MMKRNLKHFPASASGFRLEERNEDIPVDSNSRERQKSIARAQVISKRFVMDKAMCRCGAMPSPSLPLEPT